MTLADRIVVLDKGVIQQIGSPTELYERPRNKFVAGFIGSPQMNFIDGHLKIDSAETEKLQLDSNETIELNGASRPESEGQYTLGIRPESLKLCSPGEPYDFEAKVALIEPHGFETHLVVKIIGLSLTLRTSESRRFQVDQTVHLRINREKLYWFEGGPNGERIAPASAAEHHECD